MTEIAWCPELSKPDCFRIQERHQLCVVAKYFGPPCLEDMFEVLRNFLNRCQIKYLAEDLETHLGAFQGHKDVCDSKSGEKCRQDTEGIETRQD